LILRISTEDTPCTRRPQAIYCTTTTHRKKTPGSITNMRISNMNWSEGFNMMLRGSMALT
ncbi:hypothetical protein ACSLOF_26470, partial [Escherichia coli]|uniref:hypothetical protein n=1 Tax=Escherichia coli TaxID=562 RepID=UPI003EE03556